MVDTRQVVREVLRLVEEMSGLPVVVQEDPNSRLPASARIARSGAPAHVIKYNPSLASPPDYVICFQCGFILRLFGNPPEGRFDLAGNPRARQTVQQLLSGPNGPARRMNLRPDVIEGLRDQLFDGLMRQLRSVPIGLRIDAWIMTHHPALAELQRTEVMRQLQENLTTLGPDVRRIVPSKVYQASVTMNAAFATFWARAWTDDSLTVPYASAGLRKEASGLLDFFDEIPDDAAHDRELINRWAEALTLSTWYEWIPYSPSAR